MATSESSIAITDASRVKPAIVLEWETGVYVVTKKMNIIRIVIPFRRQTGGLDPARVGDRDRTRGCRHEVLLNQWNARFYNALQDRDWDSFVTSSAFFCILAACYIVLAVYQLYLNQWLQIRWRRWMTSAISAHGSMAPTITACSLLGDAADNPDQRIAEDVQLFIEQHAGDRRRAARAAIVTLGSFIIILWTLVGGGAAHAVRREWNIPGYLVWAALIYALRRHLVHASDRPAAGRAQFQPAAVRGRLPLQSGARARELRADRAAHGRAGRARRLLDRFGRVVDNWLRS